MKEKEVNFRIIELPTHQVLLTKDFDNENDEAGLLLVITVFLDGVKVDLKLNYKDEEVRNRLFLEMTEVMAQSFLDNVISGVF